MPTDDVASPRRPEDARGRDEFFGPDIGIPRRRLRREAVHRATEVVEAGDVLGDELVVVELFGEDDVEHRCEQRSVVPWQRLEMDLGQPGCLGVPRVDDQQLHAPVGLLPQPYGRVAPGSSLVGDGRVDPDEERDVRLVVTRHGSHPPSVQSFGNLLAGLVDRGRRKSHAGTDRGPERVHEHPAGRVCRRQCPGVEGNGVWTVAVPDLREPGRDVAHRLGQGDRLVLSVARAFLGPDQSVWIAQQGRLQATLEAGVAAVDRVVLMPDHLGHDAAANRHVQVASVEADTAVRAMDGLAAGSLGVLISR